MNGSPAICCENRVHRAHSTHRSRSSSTSVDSGIGLGKVRFTSVKRDSARPVDIAWFCSGHSPPLSHTGQSSGWLISSSSITPRCAFSAAGEVIWVRTTIPSVTVVVHDASGLRCPSTSTRHCRHAPTGSSRGWSQNRGIWIPISSAARITNVPLGTWNSAPSMVIETSVSVRVSCVSVIMPPPLGSTRGWSACGSNGHACRPRCALVLVAEVLERTHDRARRAVAQRAERLAEDGVGDVEQLAEVLGGALARSRAAVDLHQPVGALAARRALAARFVGVELASTGATARTTQVVSSKICSALVPSIDPTPRHALVIQWHVEVFGGEHRRRRSARRPELQFVARAHAAGVARAVRAA